MMSDLMLAGILGLIAVVCPLAPLALSYYVFDRGEQA